MLPRKHPQRSRCKTYGGLLRSTLRVSLTAELLRRIGEDVSSGRYQSVSEVVDAALRTFYGEKAIPDPSGTADIASSRSKEQVEALFAQAAAGMAQVDLTGHFVPVSYTHLTLPTNREV